MGGLRAGFEIARAGKEYYSIVSGKINLGDVDVELSRISFNNLGYNQVKFHTENTSYFKKFKVTPGADLIVHPFETSLILSFEISRTF